MAAQGNSTRRNCPSSLLLLLLLFFFKLGIHQGTAGC
jgi:hypothetical protein